RDQDTQTRRRSATEADPTAVEPSEAATKGARRLGIVRAAPGPRATLRARRGCGHAHVGCAAPCARSAETAQRMERSRPAAWGRTQGAVGTLRPSLRKSLCTRR